MGSNIRVIYGKHIVIILYHEYIKNKKIIVYSQNTCKSARDLRFESFYDRINENSLQQCNGDNFDFYKKVKKAQMSLAFGQFNLAEYGVMVAPITLDDTVQVRILLFRPTLYRQQLSIICGFSVMVAHRLSKARELFDSAILLKN